MGGVKNVIVNNRLYANIVNDIYYAKLNTDGSTGPWVTSSNPLPQYSRDHTSVVANGYVYVIGGFGTTDYSTVFYAKLNSNGSIGSWVKTKGRAVLPKPLQLHTTVVFNGYAYVAGGYNNGSGGNQSAVYIAQLKTDGSVGPWVTSSNSLPSFNRDHTSTAANGHVYIIGGDNNRSDTETARSTVLHAKINIDGSLSPWVTSANALPQGLSSHTSIIANGYNYVLGGEAKPSAIFDKDAQSKVLNSKLNLDGTIGAWKDALIKTPQPEPGV